MATPEQVRQAVVRAAIPLVGEYETLTTARIAREAGVEESDLVAVFPDTDAVLQACVATMTARLTAAMDPAGEIRALAAIRVDQPLASRLTEVLGVVDAYHRRVRADLEAFEQAAAAPGTASSDPDGLRFLNSRPELRQAVVRLLEPDRPALRLPPEALAEAFLTFAHVGSRTALRADQVVDLFLHGALRTP